MYYICRYGGIGRHIGLKILGWRHREGSTPRGCTTYISECGKVWLIRMPWEHETVGSNPAIRTTTYLKYLICAVSSVGRARDF